MAGATRARPSTGIRYTLEVLFSLNLAFVTVFLAFLRWRGLVERINYHEVDIKMLLHMRVTDYNSGFIGIWLPSVVLGLCFWALLRVTSRTRVAGEVLRFAPGLVALFSIPGFWLYEVLRIAQYYSRLPIGAFHWGAPLELALALYCAYLFVTTGCPGSTWRGVLLLTIHFGYWNLLFLTENVWPDSAWRGVLRLFVYWNPLAGGWTPGLLGPVGFVVSFCTSLAWWAYVRGLHTKAPKELVTA